MFISAIDGETKDAKQRKRGTKDHTISECRFVLLYGRLSGRGIWGFRSWESAGVPLKLCSLNSSSLVKRKRERDNAKMDSLSLPFIHLFMAPFKVGAQTNG